MGLMENMVSVVIPAYNEPTTSAGRSIGLGTDSTGHRGDCGGRLLADSLEPVIGEFAGWRMSTSRSGTFDTPEPGVMDNFHSGVAQAKGKYLVPLPHDNRFTTGVFLQSRLKE